MNSCLILSNHRSRSFCPVPELYGGRGQGGQTNCPVGHFNKCIESLILLSRPHLEMTAIPTRSARTVKIPEDFVVFMDA